jgi:hypothetical protein
MGLNPLKQLKWSHISSWMKLQKICIFKYSCPVAELISLSTPDWHLHIIYGSFILHPCSTYSFYEASSVYWSVKEDSNEIRNPVELYYKAGKIHVQIVIWSQPILFTKNYSFVYINFHFFRFSGLFNLRSQKAFVKCDL